MKTIGVVLLCGFALAVSAQDSPALKLAKTIPLPGVKGRFDHFAMDVKGNRLFVAALGNNTLEVLDTAAAKRLKTISDLHKPTGVLFPAEAGQIGVANGDDGSFKLFDGAAYGLLNNLRALDDADNVRRDAKTQLIYVGYAEGALGIIDATGRKHLGDIKLPAHPESFQLETQGNRIFVNVPDAKQVAVIDREKRVVLAHWPMERFQANFPMALDEANHRLFVGCRKPPRLIVFDTEAGAPVTDLDIAGDTDDLFYDAKRQRIYVSCGEGFVDIIDQRDANTYQRRERIPTRGGARTSFFSVQLDEFYLAVPQRTGQEAEIRVYQPK